jgi:hypothetical protein
MYKYKERTNWDIERYAEHISLRNTGVPDDFDKLLQSKFEPLAGDIIRILPLTVADRHGKLLLWYLPGIFTPKRHVCHHVFNCNPASYS